MSISTVNPRSLEVTNCAGWVGIEVVEGRNWVGVGTDVALPRLKPKAGVCCAGVCCPRAWGDVRRDGGRGFTGRENADRLAAELVSRTAAVGPRSDLDVASEAESAVEKEVDSDGTCKPGGKFTSSSDRSDRSVSSVSESEMAAEEPKVSFVGLDGKEDP